MPYRESTSRVTFMECLMNVLVIRRPFICIPSSLPPFYCKKSLKSKIFFKFKEMVESNIKQGSAFVVNHN